MYNPNLTMNIVIVLAGSCGPAPLIRNAANISGSETNLVGEEETFRCLDGYTLLGLDSVVTCLPTLEWSDNKGCTSMFA